MTTAGCSDNSVAISPTKATLTVTLPDPPHGGSLVLAYSAGDGGVPITGFQVNLGGNWLDIAASGAGEADYAGTTIGLLDTSAYYTVRVRAVNSVGAGPPSEPVVIETQAHEVSPHDLSVSAHAAHNEYYGPTNRVVFRATGIYNESSDTHTSIQIEADGVFPNHSYYWGNAPSANVGVRLYVSDTYSVGVSLRADPADDWATPGPQLHSSSIIHLRFVIGEGDEWLSINLRDLQPHPTEPYTGIIADSDKRALIRTFFDNTNRNISVPMWMMVVDTRESIPANQTPTAHPTVTYDDAEPWRGDVVTPTLSSDEGLNSIYHGGHIYQWQFRNPGQGQEWEWSPYQTLALTIPENAEPGQWWRLTWMRHTFFEFPTNYVTVTADAKPEITYDNTTPDRGDVVTATPSYTGTIRGWSWRVQSPGSNIWREATRPNNVYIPQLTIPGDAAQGQKYILRWVRGGQSVREFADTFITVTRQGLTVPSAVRNARVEIGDASATLTWDEPASDGGTTVRYKVRAFGTTNDATERTYALVGLTNGTEYMVSVWAVNDTGAGPAVDLAFTPAAVPDAPPNVSAVHGDGIVRVRWGTAEDNGSPILRYEVREGTGDAIEVDAGDRSYTFRNLTNGTQYTFQVRAVNARGAGAWGSVMSRPSTGSSNVINDNGALTIDSISHLPAHGIYALPSVFDLTGVYTCRVNSFMLTSIENTESANPLFDDEPGLFDSGVGLFDDAVAFQEDDGVDAHCEVRTRDSTGDAWSAWQKVTAADMTARYVEGRIVLTTATESLRPRVRQFQLEVLLEERREAGELTTAVGLTVNNVVSYSKQFRENPSLVVTSPNLQPQEVLIVESESAVEFHVRVQDEVARRQVRRVSWQATGHGAKK